MMCSLILLTALAQPPAEPAASAGLPPEQAVAVIDGEGKLRITQAKSTTCYGPQVREVSWSEKRGADTVQVKGTVKVNSVVLTTVELPAKFVEAYTVEGTPIPKDKLADLLAKERSVLVAVDGKKVDPFRLALYKEGTIVLVPPANTLDTGAGAYGGYGAGPYGPIPEPVPPIPAPRDKELDEKKP